MEISEPTASDAGDPVKVDDGATDGDELMYLVGDLECDGLLVGGFTGFKVGD